MNNDFEDGFEVYQKDKSSPAQAYTESYMFKHTNHAAICSKCFNIKGRVNYKAFYTVFVETEDCNTFTENEIKQEIMKTSNDLWESKLSCPKCHRKTKHFWVDDHIAHLIRMINLAGYETTYSCAGHMRDGFITSYNYITIKGDHKDEFVNDPMIRNWRFTVHEMDVSTRKKIIVTRISLSNDIPISSYNEEIRLLTEYFAMKLQLKRLEDQK